MIIYFLIKLAFKDPFSNFSIYSGLKNAFLKSRMIQSFKGCKDPIDTLKIVIK